MSRFPPHLTHPTSRSTSIHQENVVDHDENSDFRPPSPSAFPHKAHSDQSSPRSYHKHHHHQLQRSTSGGGAIGPSLISLNNYADVPVIQSLRPQDVKVSVADWIKLQNHKEEEANIRLHSGAWRNPTSSLLLLLLLLKTQSPTFIPSVPRTLSLPLSPEVSFSKPYSVRSFNENDILEDYEDNLDDIETNQEKNDSTEDENLDDDDDDEDGQEFVDSSAEIIPDDDSLDLDGPPLLALSGNTSPHVLRIVGPFGQSLTDELTTINGDDPDVLITAASQIVRDDDDNDEQEEADLGELEYEQYEPSLDPRYSLLNPHEPYIEVEPFMYGSPLAPNGTPLDFSTVESNVTTCFPFVNEPEISEDELKLCALLDYELKLAGSPGLDLEPYTRGVDLDKVERGKEDDAVEKKDSWKDGFSWIFNNGSTAQSRYAKKNPWYRILHLIDQRNSYDSNSSNGHDDDDNRNKDMFPLNYSGLLDLDPDSTNMQVVKFVPSH